MIETVNINTYSAFGFNISSEFILPELKSVRIGKSELNIAIKKEYLLVEWLNHAQPDSYYYFKQNICMIRVPDVGIFKVTDGSTISVSPYEGTKDDQIRLYLLGTCMGVVLLQRKILPVHGSCIAIHGKAYAIVGDSGAGKSTLASAFVKRGYQLLTDDIIAVKQSKENIPIVIPSYPQQKLWQESLDQFGMQSNHYKPIFNRMTKFVVPINEYFHDEPLPLAGIFELNKTEKSEIKIHPVQQLERFPILYYNTYRNFMVGHFGLLEWHFKFSAKMVNHLEFHRISRPESRFTADELVNHILKIVNKKKKPVYSHNIEKEKSL